MHPDALDGKILERLHRSFVSHTRFDYALTDIRRFPNGIYLAPDPARPFITLTEAVISAFPDYPPYEGQFPDIVPHLTVAHHEDQPSLNEIERAFAARVDGTLPLQTSAPAMSG